LNNEAPEVRHVKAIAGNYLSDIISVERVPRGLSTYVFRVISGPGTYYIRFLPENASFAAEVLAHNILLEKGVIVPRVIGFEHKNKTTGLSVMITEEIAGVCIEDEWPHGALRGILREAGRQIALVHEVPVDGFGWIDRTSYDKLKAEKLTFQDYFNEFLSYDLDTLERYEFTDTERLYFADLMETTRRMLDVKDTVLVHGDFDVSHIFHSNSRYSGLIDLSEIRGNNRLFDLATFAIFDRSPDRISYSYLLEGYREMTSLTDNDLYTVELTALFQVLRFLGKKVEQPGVREGFFHLAKKQLERIKNFTCN
jgi:aminoglycoside phosphotransferase (APT) family kinase protein